MVDDRTGAQSLYDLVLHALHDVVLVHAVISTATVHKRTALANCIVNNKPRMLHFTGWTGSTHQRHRHSQPGPGPEPEQGSHLRQPQGLQW
jgi:hypothetical protein